MQLSWIELHGALTHFPVALLITAMAYEWGAVIFRKPDWRGVSYWLLLAAVVMATPSLATGWLTADSIFPAASQPPTTLVYHRLAAFMTSGLALVLLLCRARSGDRLSGRALAASLLSGFVLAGGIAYTGYLGGVMVFGGEPAPTPTVVRKPPRPNPGPGRAQLVAGEKLFRDNNCSSCHSIGGHGGRLGPDLTREGTRHPDVSWQVRHLEAPEQVVPGSSMPGFANLSPDQLRDLAAYLVSLQ